MIRVTISRTKNNQVTSFWLSGHADYADSGQDIVCSAVSVLAINTVNALSMYTSQKFETDMDEESGTFIVNFPEALSHDAELLVNTMILGLRSIENDYCEKYIHVEFREV